MNDKTLSLKERLFRLMEEIGKLYNSRKVTVIICCEGAENIPVPMVGYQNPNGSGTVLIISAMPDIILELLHEAWDERNKTVGEDGSNNEQ